MHYEADELQNGKAGFTSLERHIASPELAFAMKDRCLERGTVPAP
jgi:hypothetical protein